MQNEKKKNDKGGKMEEGTIELWNGSNVSERRATVTNRPPSFSNFGFHFSAKNKIRSKYYLINGLLIEWLTFYFSRWMK